MTTFQLNINGTEWSDSPEWIFGLIPVASIRRHIAYDTSRHQLFTASELQEQLVALGWPEGECIDLADDTPPVLSVTLELAEEDLVALQQRIDAEAAGTITIDADVEFETARRTVEVPALEAEVQAVDYISVPGLIVALSTLHPGADVRDAAAYQAAITDVLALIVRQPAPQLHLVTHDDLVTIESVLHTSRQLLIVGESDMSPTQEHAFEDDLNRMCVVTQAYLGMTDEDDADYTGCGAGKDYHRDGSPSVRSAQLPGSGAAGNGIAHAAGVGVFENDHAMHYTCQVQERLQEDFDLALKRGDDSTALAALQLLVAMWQASPFSVPDRSIAGTWRAQFHAVIETNWANPSERLSEVDAVFTQIATLADWQPLALESETAQGDHAELIIGTNGLRGFGHGELHFTEAAALNGPIWSLCQAYSADALTATPLPIGARVLRQKICAKCWAHARYVLYLVAQVQEQTGADNAGGA